MVGRRLAFVRDSGDDTAIVVLDIESGNEQIIDTPAIELDPEFSADGKFLFHTSGESGSLEAGTDETLTNLNQVVRNARRLPDGNGVLYLHGTGAHRVLRECDFVEGHDRIAHAETLTYHLSADVHPELRLIVYSAPIDNDYHLWTVDLDDPRVTHRLTDGHPYAMMPAFSADGDHTDALRLMAGEALDQLAPMSWNRWERRIDRDMAGKETTGDGRTVHQGQEVRSHFHGHVGLLNVDTPFAHWFFGPNNPTLGDPDRTNGEVFEFADKYGAFATYVHPIATDRDPFTHLEDKPIPLELISDGILAERMGLELVCAWTSPLGNSEVWYRLLNVGKPVAAMSGTDGWVDFHRTLAMGTGRTYVRTDSPDTAAKAVVQAAAAGRSFVTTGPALIFELDDGASPGDVASSGTRGWQVTLASTNDIEIVEIIVNGSVVETLEGVEADQTRTFSGEIDLPEGGWIAARAYAAEQRADSWPTMHARPFAHSSPIWIGEIGSTEPAAQAEAAVDLIRAIDAAEERAQEAYGDVDISRMQARFDQARARLAEMID